MSALTLDRIVTLLEDFVRQTGAQLDLLLIGRLALHAYGAAEAQAEDLDAELVGYVDELGVYLKRHEVPASLSENISGWSVVAMSPVYRERASVLFERGKLRLRLLSPVDFVIGTLRRGTDTATVSAIRRQLRY